MARFDRTLSIADVAVGQTLPPQTIAIDRRSEERRVGK